MQTLMRTDTFNELQKIRSTLAARPLGPRQSGAPAGVFVPWAGPRLIKEGGIYYVGMATRGYYGADSPQTLEQQFEIATSFCTKRHDLVTTPFWQFLDGLTWALLGAPFEVTSDRWGWSNILKIGWTNEASPDKWPQMVKSAQQDICTISLREEFGQLQNSLIVIVSHSTQNVLDNNELFRRLIPNWNANFQDNWEKCFGEQTGLWWVKDHSSGNLYVHGYHPRAAMSQGFWGSALGRTIHLARAFLPQFVNLA